MCDRASLDPVGPLVGDPPPCNQGGDRSQRCLLREQSRRNRNKRKRVPVLISQEQGDQNEIDCEEILTTTCPTNEHGYGRHSRERASCKQGKRSASEPRCKKCEKDYGSGKVGEIE